jgi:hypothetical protein
VAIEVDFELARRCAEEHTQHADPGLRMLAQAFLILNREAIDGHGVVSPETAAFQQKCMEAALVLAEQKRPGTYSPDEILRATRRKEWELVSIMMAYNAGRRDDDSKGSK